MGTQAAGPGSPPRGSLARRLLAAAVLSCCFLLTQAQDIPVTVNPPQPVEGQEVTLTPGGSPNIFTCNWFRGGDLPPNQIFVYLPSSEQENGPGYTGRETGGSNCSLHIRSLTLNDTGKYTVLKTTSTGLPEKGSVQIQVLGFLTKPSVSAFPTPFPIESMGSVTLTCETTFEEVLFSWFYDGEPLNGSSRIQISGDNRTVVTSDAIRSDTGEYQCQVTNPISASRSDSLYVAVIYGPDTPVIQPTEGFYHQHSEIRLFCYADAFPDPHYIWFVNGKERNTTSELLIPDATPEDSGTYVCQAWNVLSHHKDNATLGIAVAAAILSSCFLLTQAQNILVTLNPPQPKEGQDVTMIPGGSTDLFSVNWFRGEDVRENRIFVYLLTSGQQNGPRYTGRETGSSNGSLYIRRLMLNDSGKYTVMKTTIKGLPEIGIVHLDVLERGSGSDPVPVTPSKAGKRAVLGITAWSLAGAVLVGILL